MARRPRRPRPERPSQESRNPPVTPESAEQAEVGPEFEVPRFWNRRRMTLAVALLITIHLTLAVRSLVVESPTVDEVAHLPAGVTYWQKGTFRLYHHNPPLIKLIASLPVVLAHPETEALYNQPSWKDDAPSQATFSQTFAYLNASRYFELFARGRLTIPVFSVLGGLVVLAWSSRLYGAGGGFLSLVLWLFCPNVLAHCRLVTSDLGASSLGVAATYLFWRYLREPKLRWAIVAGFALGLAQLSKFSLVLLYGLWPFFWAERLVLTTEWRGWPRALAKGVGHGLVIVVLSVVVIDAGYLFEGVGTPLGRFEFASETLTRPTTPNELRPKSKNWLLEKAWQHRVNRFRRSFLDALPSPLPSHYLLGFDEQKLESEGVPVEWLDDRPVARDNTAASKRTLGYTVYLNGELRQSGWWYYYLLTLAYKVPEGTWILVLCSIVVMFARRRSREDWADEIMLATVPLTILFTMSVLTDINLGLRYVLPIVPYVLISAGKVVPWALQMTGGRRRVALGFVTGSALLTILAAFSIHPHYLAYFNVASGGPDRRPPRLIDSNLDWGQDLLQLKEWVARNAPQEPIGLAYFGQINPSIFTLRDEGFDWFVPPAIPGTISPMPGVDQSVLTGPAPRLTPGWYAISATLVYGLPWRLYDPAPVPQAWSPTWSAGENAFKYFQLLTPYTTIGHSIYLYRVTEADAARLGPSLGQGNQQQP